MFLLWVPQLENSAGRFTSYEREADDVLCRGVSADLSSPAETGKKWANLSAHNLVVDEIVAKKVQSF